jgi:hypothetical protein
MVNERPILERTRWFKKNIIKKTIKNLNPLEIFQIESSYKPRLISKLQNICSCSLPNTTINQLDTINNNIFKLLE